jgi:hypothetical protein
MSLVLNTGERHCYAQAELGAYIGGMEEYQDTVIDAFR